MPKRLVILLLAAIGFLAPQAGRAIDLCFGEVTVRCVRELGHDYQACGPLTMDGGTREIFENCGDTRSGHCYPCAFGSSQATANACYEQYGPECNRYLVGEVRR